VTRTFDYVLKAAIHDDEKRLIKGYATVDLVDRDDEIIDVSSVAKSFESYMDRNPVVLRDHDLRKAIGKTLEYSADSSKVEVLVEIAKNAKDADEAWSLIKQGILRSFSIRGKPSKVQYIKKDGRRVRKIGLNDILELSVVSVGSNQDSLFDVVSKSVSQSDEMTEEDMKVLKEDISKTISTEIEKQLTSKFEELNKTLEDIKKGIKTEDPKKDQTEDPPADDNSKLLAMVTKTVQDTVKKTISESTELNTIQKALSSVPPADEEKEPDKWDLETFAKKFGGK